jgi:hypothetical protein
MVPSRLMCKQGDCRSYAHRRVACGKGYLVACKDHADSVRLVIHLKRRLANQQFECEDAHRPHVHLCNTGTVHLWYAEVTGPVNVKTSILLRTNVGHSSEG